MSPSPTGLVLALWCGFNLSTTALSRHGSSMPSSAFIRPQPFRSTSSSSSSAIHDKPRPWSLASGPKPGRRRLIVANMDPSSHHPSGQSTFGAMASTSTTASSSTATAAATTMWSEALDQSIITTTAPPDAWSITLSGNGRGGDDDDGGRRGGGGGGSGGEEGDGGSLARPLALEWFAPLLLLWERYVELLDKHPFRTKAITAGLVAFLGDMLAQFLEEQVFGKNDDPDRTHPLVRSFAVFLEALLLTGPMLHILYGALEHFIPTHSNHWAAVPHIAADELIFGPFFILAFFFVCGALEGKHIQNEVVPQVQNEYWPALKGGWTVSVFFLPLKFCTFRFLPVRYRVLVVNLGDVIWTGVVSYFSHKGENAAEGQPKLST